MIRFTVLNEEEQTKTREEESVEVQAEKSLSVCQSAIRLLHKGKAEEAGRLLKNLIESDLFQTIDDDSELAARGTPLRLLQYLVYSNYASIVEQSPNEAAGSALHYYLKAATFDNTDSSIWYKIGTLAAKEKRWKLARYALECGLYESPFEEDGQMPGRETDFDFEEQDLKPTQWSCLEALCEVLFEIGDYTACHDYVGKALRISPYFQRGLQLQQQMRDRMDISILHNIFSASEQTPVNGISSGDNDDATQERLLEEPTWTRLGELLLEEYTNHDASNNYFYNKRLVIRIQKSHIDDDDVEMTEAPKDNVEESLPPEIETNGETNGSADENTTTLPTSTTTDDSTGNNAAGESTTTEQGDKDGADADQSAAMKRKRREIEERSGLRTSKRVRDKLDQFEVTKKKRQEEEQEILAKYTVVLSKFGMNLDTAYIACKRANTQQAPDIFPKGLSPLLAVFNKHLERPNSFVQASATDNTQQRKTNHFAIFTTEKVETPIDGLFDTVSLIEEFVNETNEANSGVVEYMSAYIVALMFRPAQSQDQPSNWQRKWPEGLRSVVERIISAIQDHLVEYLHDEHPVEGDTLHTEQAMRLEIQLSIAEMYLDGMVNYILLPQATATRRGRITRKLDPEQLALLEKKFQMWLFQAGLLWSSLEEQSHGWTWMRTIVLRQEWMLGRYEQCLGNASKAIAHFDKCLALFQENPPPLTIALPNCKYDTVVEEQTIQERRRKLHTHQYVLDAERLYCEKEYKDVMDRLEPIFLIPNTSVPSTVASESDNAVAPSTIGGSLSERLELMTLLYKDRLVDDDIKISYADLWKNRPHLEQFNLVLVRVWLVLLLILPGWFQEHQEKWSKDEQDVEMIESEPPLALESTPIDLQSTLLDENTLQRILVKPLTSNSSTPLSQYTSPSPELYMELIALVHDDLGVRGICGIDNGQLIQLALKVSSPMPGSFYRREENQCYYCFYGISLSVDGQYPIEHSSEPVDFDRRAATEFFPLLERSLSDRALRGQVRSDIKDAVDRVEEALGSPPYESNVILSMNQQLIDAYLASDINFAEAIQVNSSYKLPTMTQPPSSKLPVVYRKIYAIQGKIYLAQFKNKAKNNQFKPLEDLQYAINQFRIDIHVNPDCWDSWYALAICYAYLADENLVFSASDIKNNFSKIRDLHKRSFLCFSQAVRLAPKRATKAEQSGNGKGPSQEQQMVTEISETSKDTLFLVGMDSKDTQEDDEDDEDKGEEGEEEGKGEKSKRNTTAGQNGAIQEWHQKQSMFWFDFGNLICGIMSRPVRMEAMGRGGGMEAMSATGEIHTVEIPEPTEEQVYKFAAFCFARSLKLNRQNWRTFFMLGKCIEKLDGKPQQVLSLYQTAADLAPARSGQPGNEKVFEPAYKLISTMTKYLATDKIQPETVESVMRRSLAKSKLSVVEGEAFIFEPPKEYLQSIQSDPPTEEDLKKSQKLHAFKLLSEGLARIRHVDKRHWHHRPVFRQAWILYHIYHDVERAKTEMLSLFQVKSNLKTLVSSVWKPEFERCGKHFVYVGEYTKLLIVLAKETKDVETLNTLARKIRKATGLLLDVKDVWGLLYDSYLEVLADLVGPDPVLAVAEVIPRTEFKEKAAIYEARMFELDPRPPGLLVLQRLCELKKLNEKMVPEGQIGHLLAVCYSKLFLEAGGTELYPKELVRQINGEISSEGSNTASSAVLETDTPTASEEPLKVGAAVEGEQSTNAEVEDQDAAQGDAQVKEAQISNGSAVKTGGDKQEQVETRDPGSINDKDTQETSPANESTPRTGDNEADSISGQTAAETQDTSGMDVDPNMEDWKSRKKISESELASRATVMCKAPPPSLRAPQTIQNRLAGPGTLVSEDVASPAVTAGESTDVVMTAAESGEQDTKAEAEGEGKDGNVATNDAEAIKAQGDMGDEENNDKEGTGADEKDRVKEDHVKEDVDLTMEDRDGRDSSPVVQ
ncbi:Histone transcription regulator 3 [Podila epigama]|nr:Histone transcription regulator 3 [Podila epigama]